MRTLLRTALASTALVSACPDALAQAISIGTSAITTLPAPVNFGASIAILSDMDGLGRRDLLVGAPGDGLSTSPSGQCYVMSTETSAPLGAFPVLNAFQLGFPPGMLGLQIGHAVVNVGNIDSDPADDFAISVPNVGGNQGRVFLVSMRPGFGGHQFRPLGFLTGLQSFGQSLAMVNGPAGPLLAVGVPGLNQVALFDLPALMTTGVIPPTAQPVRTLSDPSQGATGLLGSSIAAGPATTPTGVPSFFVAVGAPNHSPNPLSPSFEGYVAIYDLSTTPDVPVARLRRSQLQERLGGAVAAAGFLPNPPLPAPASPRPDFAALGGNGQFVLFHTPSSPLVPATVAASATFSAPLASDGRAVTAGDLDGDSIGDVAALSGGVLRIFSTRNGTLTQLAQTVAATSFCGLTSGPDVFRTGVIDTVVGPTFGAPTPPTVRVLPIASSSVLPNATTLRLSPNPLLRPILSAPAIPNNYQLTVTTQGSGGTDLVVLFCDIAPITPTPAAPPFGGGLIFLGPALIDLGWGTVSPGVPFTWQFTMPTTGLFVTGVFQAALVPVSGPFVASDGVLARFGAF